MFIAARPIGVNTPSDDDRLPIWRVTGGDSLTLETRLVEPASGAPATPENSLVVFALAESRFFETMYWTGQWNDGILPVDTSPGLVKVTIPAWVADTLRRGSYVFSIHITDKLLSVRDTPVKGTLILDYEPTSPHHDIPYRNDQ